VTGISIEQVGKRFGEVVALNRVSLEIAPGEVFFLLGPSGCGKTTLLRCLAGFELPDEGFIRFGGEDVTRVPAHKRRTGMVFQNYALWPHKTVAENVAFGLEELRTPREETVRRVGEALASVRMEAYGARAINQLSGGQQQRIALARALVVRPRCLLLDEPLSNLDAKLRLEMRTEIRRICKESGLTAVYVTHDQKEALSVADRIAVFDAGCVCQVGAPGEVYRRPISRFVADFIGETNFLEGEVVSISAGTVLVAVENVRLQVSSETGAAPRVGEAVTLSIRPEAWRLAVGSGILAGNVVNTIGGSIAEAVYLGEMAQYLVKTALPGVSLKVYEMNPAGKVAEGGCSVSVAPEDIVLLR